MQCGPAPTNWPASGCAGGRTYYPPLNRARVPRRHWCNHCFQLLPLLKRVCRDRISYVFTIDGSGSQGLPTLRMLCSGNGSIAVKQRFEAITASGKAIVPASREGAAVPVAQREATKRCPSPQACWQQLPLDGISPAHPQLAMQFAKLVLA